MKLTLSILVFVFLPLSVTSCGWPITVGVQSDDYGVGGSYSPKGGLKLNVNADKIIERNSGK